MFERKYTTLYDFLETLPDNTKMNINIYDYEGNIFNYSTLSGVTKNDLSNDILHNTYIVKFEGSLEYAISIYVKYIYPFKDAITVGTFVSLLPFDDYSHQAGNRDMTINLVNRDGGLIFKHDIGSYHGQTEGRHRIFEYLDCRVLSMKPEMVDYAANDVCGANDLHVYLTLVIDTDEDNNPIHISPMKEINNILNRR